MIRLLSSVVLGVLLAQAAAGQPPSRGKDVPRRVGLPSFCIPVMIGSEGPFLFGFDTGISPSTVTAELVRRLKLPALGEVQVTDASDSGHHAAKAVRIDSLVALGKTFPRHLAVVVSTGEQGCPGPVSGTLGLSLFQEFLLAVDLQAASLELTRGRLTESDSHTLPYTVGRSMPMVKIAVGPALLRAGIDSGGQFGIILPTSVAEKLPLGPILATGRMRTIIGEFPFKQAQLYGTLVLGGNDVPGPIVTLSDHFPIAIMGRHLLARFVLTFDQKNHLVRVAPRGARKAKGK